MGEPSRPIDFSAFIDSIGNIELTDWQRQVFADLPAGTLNLTGAWDTPRQHGAGHSVTVTGRMFYKGRDRWVLRPRRWQPFDRSHHAEPVNGARVHHEPTCQMLADPPPGWPFGGFSCNCAAGRLDSYLAAERRVTAMRSAYRARSRRRVRRG